MEDYIIVRATSLVALQNEVNGKIRVGYEPLGGPFVTPACRPAELNHQHWSGEKHCQAMCLR